MRHIILALGIPLLASGCGPGSGDEVADDDASDDDAADDDAADDDASDDDASDDDASDDDTVPEDRTVPAHVLDGSVTWTLDVDAGAEAAGHADCSYTRSYSLVEILDVPWTCPSCDVLLSAEVEVTEGYDECYAPLLGGDRVATETVGIDLPDGGAGDAVFYRTSVQNAPMNALDEEVPYEEGEPIQVDWASDMELPDGTGTAALAAAGELTLALDPEIRIEDPLIPRTEPYACGWPLGNPGGAHDVSYAAELGGTLPDAVLVDACGEGVHLWDFYGSYLVVDASVTDCGPCQSMAAGAEAFQEEIVALGIPLRLVTLLGTSLSDPLSPAPADEIDAWIDDYGLSGPVLGDRGYGYSVLSRVAGEDFGYPTWVVVAPDLTLVHVNVGFGSTTWDDVEAVVLAHAGG